jgi:hypothetical protein
LDLRSNALVQFTSYFAVKKTPGKEFFPPGADKLTRRLLSKPAWLSSALVLRQVSVPALLRASALT